MNDSSVQRLLDDIRLLGDNQLLLVESVRRLIKQAIPLVAEEVKYGGIIFSDDVHFCGVFAYQNHVSVEFSCGAKISDPFGYLEGAGKFRRHLKITSLNDIEAKKLRNYIPLALDAARYSIKKF